MEYKWPLSIPQFSFLDKLKLVSSLLTNDRWTHGETVIKFEEEMAKYVGCKYSVFTSSGSTANTILAMYLRDTTEPTRNVIVFPSTTWITSVSPFIREGFEAEFIDINLDDFSMDLTTLEAYLEQNISKVVCVFLTSLIGFTPNMSRLKYLAEKYKVRIMMDNCENTLGRYGSENISSFFTSTTSTYFGHQLQSVEGGFIFTNSESERDYFLMARNHGMLRHLPVERREFYRNKEVDAQFDFAILGNNFRNTNINAFLGLCDLKRADKYLDSRRELYGIFYTYLNPYLVLPVETPSAENAPFCLPIIVKEQYKDKLQIIKDFCISSSIETRPIISGNLLRQSCLKRDDFANFKNSEYLHQNGFYIGLHGSTKSGDVLKLSKKILSLLTNK